MGWSGLKSSFPQAITAQAYARALEVDISMLMSPTEPKQSCHMWLECTWMLSVLVEAQAMDIYLFLLSVIVFVAAVGAVFALLLRFVLREWERDLSMKDQCVPEIVLIEDSPPPTRMPSTPTSSVYGTVRRRPKRAGWKGSQRRPSHRRRETRKFDPALANDCGFQCVLRAAKRQCGIEAVRELRSQVAGKIYEKRVCGERVCGVDIHDLDCEGRPYTCCLL